MVLWVCFSNTHTDEESWDDMRMECEKCGAMKGLAERKPQGECEYVFD